MSGLRKTIAMLWMTLLCSPASADTLRVALFDVAPFSYAGSDGRPVGIHVEMAAELARRAGYEPQIMLVPFARRDHQLLAGDADLTIGLQTEQLVPLRRFGPVMTVDSVLLSYHELASTEHAELAKLRIGRIRGGCLDLQQHAEVAPALVDINNYASGLAMLQGGRLDAICGSDLAIGFAVQEARLGHSSLHTAVITAGRQMWVFLSPHASLLMQQRVEHAVRLGELQR